MLTRAKAKKPCTASILPADALSVVASMDVEVAVKMPAVCKHWHEAKKNGHGDANDAMIAIAGLGADACMQDVMAALALSSDKVKLGAYRQKRNRYGGFYNIFYLRTMLLLFRRNGGWAGLNTRLQRRRARCAKRLVF